MLFSSSKKKTHATEDKNQAPTELQRAEAEVSNLKIELKRADERLADLELAKQRAIDDGPSFAHAQAELAAATTESERLKMMLARAEANLAKRVREDKEEQFKRAQAEATKARAGVEATARHFGQTLGALRAAKRQLDGHTQSIIDAEEVARALAKDLQIPYASPSPEPKEFVDAHVMVAAHEHSGPFYSLRGSIEWSSSNSKEELAHNLRTTLGLPSTIPGREYPIAKQISDLLSGTYQSTMNALSNTKRRIFASDDAEVAVSED